MFNTEESHNSQESSFYVAHRSLLDQLSRELAASAYLLSSVCITAGPKLDVCKSICNPRLHLDEGFTV